MLGGLCLAEPLIQKIKNGSKLRLLVCGTGTGIFTMYLRQHFSQCMESVTTVEIDGDILNLAKEHFGFGADQDDSIISIQADAFEFVQSESQKYDLIFFDVDYCEDEKKSVSPPAKYLTTEFMTCLVDMLGEDGGVVAFNTLIKDSKVKRQCQSQIKAVADAVKFTVSVEEDVNQIYFLARGINDEKTLEKMELPPNRVEKINQVANALKLPKGVLFTNTKVYDLVKEMVQL